MDIVIDKLENVPVIQIGEDLVVMKLILNVPINVLVMESVIQKQEFANVM